VLNGRMDGWPAPSVMVRSFCPRLQRGWCFVASIGSSMVWFFFCELQTIVNTNHIENLNRTRYQETEKISYFDSAQFRSSSFFAASTIAMHMHINSFILNSNDVMT